MNVISNKYISLGVGTPLNKKNFTLASTVDTTDFIGGGTFTEKAITTTGIDDAKVLRITMTAAQTTANKTVLESIGIVNSLQDQVTILNNKPEYEVLWTGNENFASRNDGCQFTFTPLTVGEEIDNWDETKLMLFTKSDSPDMDGGNWRSVRANATWSDSTQYYYCNEAGSLYYITDKNNPNKRLRFYLGEGPLSYDNKRMSLCILSTHVGASDNYDGWWTTQVYDPDTQTTTNQRLVVASQSGTFVRTVNAISGVSNLFAGTNRGRDMSSSTYNSGWLTGTSDDTKQEFRMYHTTHTIYTNSTITQFGQVKKGDRTYFGIWVVYPKTQHYVGLKADADISIAASHGTSAGDMRSYGFGEIEKPHYENLEIEEVEFYGIELSKININIDIKEGQTPPDVNYNPNVSAIWPSLDPTVLNGRHFGSLADKDSHGFHIYQIPWGTFKNDFLGRIWNWGDSRQSVLNALTEGEGAVEVIDILSAILSGGASLFGQMAADNIEIQRIDPMSAIAFSRSLPEFVKRSRMQHMIEKISIAGFEVALSSPAAIVLDEVVGYNFDIDCGGLLTTGSYLDYAPYSTAEIYLPYIGTVQVDPTDFVGGSINVQYNCCLIDGTISAHLTCYPGYSTTYPVQYGPFVGSGSFEFPLAQKDANAFQRQLGYVKAIGTGVTGAFGSFIGAAGAASSMKTAGSGLLDSMMLKQNLRASQLGSGSAIVVPTDGVKVMVTTPLPMYLSLEDINKFGTASGKITTVQNAQREGQKTFCKFKYFDASSINEATPEEKDAIQRAFVGGVYI